MNSPDPTSNAATGAASAKLVGAVRRVLRPLIRLLLSHGLTYPWLSDLLKEIYVEVADREFQLDTKRQTDSRISLLTGVHRKDVRRLRAAPPDPRAVTPPVVSLGAQLVARWVTDSSYLDDEGAPLPLPRLASQGGNLSFDGLVASVSKDIRARAVLDEWLRLGVARLDEQDRVVLNVDAFIPAQGFDEKVYYFGQNVHDHLAATVFNVMGVSPPYLERSVHYNMLTAESAHELSALATRAGMQALKAVNRRAVQLAEADADSEAATHRINFGIYFYSEQVPEDPSGDVDA
ncbi:MAG: hypothetical protein GC151_17070 [Betaproteobacteria bacterium]|nr:hypothetical protein [Betaproteobacteria bacterium]